MLWSGSLMYTDKYNDGRSCSICGNLKTTYHEWNCNGNWHYESESECLMGHDLEETNGTQCDDYFDG